MGGNEDNLKKTDPINSEKIACIKFHCDPTFGNLLKSGGKSFGGTVSELVRVTYIFQNVEKFQEKHRGIMRRSQTANFIVIRLFKIIKNRGKIFLGPVHRSGGRYFFRNSRKFINAHPKNNEKISHIKLHCNPTVRI